MLSWLYLDVSPPPVVPPCIFVSRGVPTLPLPLLLPPLLVDPDVDGLAAGDASFPEKLPRLPLPVELPLPLELVDEPLPESLSLELPLDLPPPPLLPAPRATTAGSETSAVASASIVLVIEASSAS